MRKRGDFRRLEAGGEVILPSFCIISVILQASLA